MDGIDWSTLRLRDTPNDPNNNNANNQQSSSSSSSSSSTASTKEQRSKVNEKEEASKRRKRKFHKSLEQLEYLLHHSSVESGMSFNHELLSLSRQAFTALDSIYSSVLKEPDYRCNPLLWGRLGELRLAYAYQEESLKRANEDRLLYTSQIGRQHDDGSFSALRLLDCSSANITEHLDGPLKCLKKALRCFQKDPEDVEGKPSFTSHSYDYHLPLDEKFLRRFWTNMKVSLGYCYLTSGDYDAALRVLEPLRDFETSKITDKSLILLGFLYSAEACRALGLTCQAYDMLDYSSHVERLAKLDQWSSSSSPTSSTSNLNFRPLFAYNLLSLHTSHGLCDQLVVRLASNAQQSDALLRGTILSMSLLEHIKNGDNLRLEESIVQRKLIRPSDLADSKEVASASRFGQEEADELMNFRWSRMQVQALVNTDVISKGEHFIRLIDFTREAQFVAGRHRRIRSTSFSVMDDATPPTGS